MKYFSISALDLAGLNGDILSILESDLCFLVSVQSNFSSCNFQEMTTRLRSGIIRHTDVCLPFLDTLITSVLLNSTMSTLGLSVPVMIRLSGFGTGSRGLAFQC